MMMRLTLVLVLWLVPAALRADGLTVQLRGPGLAESAGFLLAEARGFYADEGLEVTLRPASEAPPLEALARGDADLAVEWLPAALVARENGLPVVNLAQVFARPALRLACRRDAGVDSAADLRGRSIASPFRGAELPLLAWLNRLALRPDDSLSGVALLAQWPAGDMLREGQAACVTALDYAPLPGDSPVVLDPEAQGAAVLEDGLYALAASLNDPQARARMARFLRASMKGWHAAAAEPEAAARILLGPDPDEAALARQAAMIARIAVLLSVDGAPDPAAFAQSVANLRAGGNTAVLRREPQGAMTTEIAELAAPPPPPAEPQAGTGTDPAP